jgi:glycine C-acetyltransferase
MFEFPGVVLPDPELENVPDDFLQTGGSDLLARWAEHTDFWDARLAAGLDPSGRVMQGRVGPAGFALTRGQERVGGLNFASHDYLSLSGHPMLRAAAVEAIGRWGLHSAGTITEQGGSVPSHKLEELLAEWLSCREVRLCPSGWSAAYSAVRTLVREADHVVIDTLASPGFHEGARAATRNVHRLANCCNEAVASRLASIRAHDPQAGILVITESLFGLDSSVPDLRALQDLCRDWQSTLVVGVAHDLGAIGDGGLGFLGEQGMVGEVDLIVGSFSKSFASNGGFVASQQRGLKQAMTVFANPLAHSAAMAPVQCEIVQAALGIIRSREGAERRRRLLDNSLRLSSDLEARAFTVKGQPSAIVPVVLGETGVARKMTRAALAAGALVNLAEHPQVSRRNARWQLLVMADHPHPPIDRMVGIAVAAREQVRVER